MDQDDKHDPNNKLKLVPMEHTGMTKFPVSEELIKSVYITEGISPKEIAERYFLEEHQIEKIIKDNKLTELREAHIRSGLAKLQNTQVNQAQKLMDLETNFKKMRIIQLEVMLKDYMTYYSRYGHFYKVHPLTGDILKDTNGIPMHIKIPNISKEIAEMKESVTLSEGMKNLLGHLDAIINKPKDVDKIDANTIELSQFGNMFQANKTDGDEDSE